MFRIKNTDDFKKSFEQISYFIDECNIHINEEGLTIRAFDNAQMLYLEYRLDAEGIEGELDSNVFGINMVEFNKILAKISSTEKISFDITNYSLDLIVEGIYKRKYSFPLKDLDEKEFNVNLEEYPIILKKKAAILKDIFASARVVADSIVFDVTPKNISLMADGIYGKYSTSLSVNNGDAFKTKFSSHHLYNMLRNVDGEKEVEIRLSAQQPLYLTYNIGSNNLKYFLAHMFV